MKNQQEVVTLIEIRNTREFYRAPGLLEYTGQTEGLPECMKFVH